jgi:hypothetical protein
MFCRGSTPDHGRALPPSVGVTVALEHGAEKSHTKRVGGEIATVANADLATLVPGLFLAQLLLAECLA